MEASVVQKFFFSGNRESVIEVNQIKYSETFKPSVVQGVIWVGLILTNGEWLGKVFGTLWAGGTSNQGYSKYSKEFSCIKFFCLSVAGVMT